MISTSPIAKVTVVALSVSAHALAGYLWLADTDMQMAGGAEAAVEVRLGNSFADLSAGTLVPERADMAEITPEEPAPSAAMDQPAPVETAATGPSTATVASPRPATEAPSAQTAQRPERTVAAHATDAAAAVLLAPPAAAPQRQDAAHVRRANAAAQLVAVATPPNAPPSATAARVERADAPAPELTGTEIDIVEASPRPRARPERQSARVTPTRITPAPQVARGNAEQNARAGSAAGTTQAQTMRQSSTGKTADSSGNAAASTYPGLVNRKISRVRAPRVGFRGIAVVRFAVDAQGRLSALSLVQSSGSAQLDEAALSVIRRAAPFPSPPPGAQRVFQKTIQGRG